MYIRDVNWLDGVILDMIEIPKYEIDPCNTSGHIGGGT